MVAARAMVRTAQRVWMGRDGQPVTCQEKIKVLEDNLAELMASCADALEDAELMGCDRTASLEHILTALRNQG